VTALAVPGASFALTAVFLPFTFGPYPSLATYALFLLCALSLAVGAIAAALAIPSARQLRETSELLELLSAGERDEEGRKAGAG
jgi:hypothetical protein